MRFSAVLVPATAILVLLASCAQENEQSLRIDYSSFKLENGLEVILHEDRSDPIVAVAVLYHVGSAREEVGRTGFAHLFEHMLFQESQHVGQDQFFKKIQDAGGTLNGGTSFDRTTYYEVVPKNALEMVLWLESDRMGFLLSTVDQQAFENQQSVVQNEKRQRVDNVPYGHTGYVINKLLYPEEHPYSWQVIGSFEDLQDASLEDVRDFYKRWYGPNNATLVIAGDFDEGRTREWVEKYFGEIQPSPPTEDPGAKPITLEAQKRAFHEDNFARSPELNMVFPTVEDFHADSYALDLLANLVSDGKKAPLYRVIVEEKKLAPSVTAYQGSLEQSGAFRIRVRAFPGQNLGLVEKAIHEAFQRFETEKFTTADLDRIKAQTETNFYNGISSVLAKSFRLATYNEFAGSPDFITQDIQNSLAVTEDDIWRVYETYIKGRKYVVTSFVPKGQVDLVAEGSERFPVIEETFEAVEEPEPKVRVSDIAERIPSSFDRTVEPPKAAAPSISLPEIWTHEYSNGLRLYGIEQTELPLVNFSLTIQGGHLLDPMEKIGLANLLSRTLKEGTRTRTPLELEEAIERLGSRIVVQADDESIQFQVNSLNYRLADTYSLFEEILLDPRWDEVEFARVLKETVEAINRRDGNPSAVASSVYRKLIYGPDHILGHETIGTSDTVQGIGIADLKSFYEANFSPSLSYVCLAGSVSKEEAIELFAPLEAKWVKREVRLPEPKELEVPDHPQVYFLDFPDAKQSQIRIGHPSIARTHPNFHSATVMNYKLGGSFNGIVNLILREEKGYTYGARTVFFGSDYPGAFMASAGVDSVHTRESVEIFRDEIARYREGIGEADLEFTRNALVLSNARRFETLGALLGMLNEIAQYNLPLDYIREQEKEVQDMSVERHRILAQEYIRPDQMIYLVVGDAKTQMEGLGELGLGKPTLLDRSGNPL